MSDTDNLPELKQLAVTARAALRAAMDSEGIGSILVTGRNAAGELVELHLYARGADARKALAVLAAGGVRAWPMPGAAS